MQTFPPNTTTSSTVIITNVVDPFRFLLWFVIGTAIFLSGGITSVYFFQPSSLHEVSIQSCNVQVALSDDLVVVPTYLIERAKNRSNTFRDQIESTELLAHDHPAFASIPPEYQPLDSWKILNFPDISIAGLPKAGTSQMYQILTSHPDLIEYHQRKEFCFNLPFSKLYLDELKSTNQTSIDKMQQSFHRANDHNQLNASNIPSITRWYMLTYGGDNEANNHIPPSNRQRTVNGCHDTVTVLLQRQYLQHRFNNTSIDDKFYNHSKKLILLLRDPADWLWSAWNFWYHDGLDIQSPQTSDWAFAPFQYRSPELFHEFLLAGEDRLSPAAGMLQEYRDDMASISSQAVAATKRYQSSYPHHNQVVAWDVLVLKSEDMKPDRVLSNGFVTRLADFVGVSPDGFNTTVLHSYANCGDNKGTDSQCSEASSAYEITGYRSMLEASRELVYLHFAEECKLWAEELGVVYEGCLAIRNKYLLNE
jgi:hypothetical protein